MGLIPWFCFRNSIYSFYQVLYMVCRCSKKYYWSSRPEVLCKKGVLKNFTKIIGKHLCKNFFFKKIAGLRSANLLKNRLWHRCFPVNFAKFLKIPFFLQNTSAGCFLSLLWPVIFGKRRFYQNKKTYRLCTYKIKKLNIIITTI